MSKFGKLYVNVRKDVYKEIDVLEVVNESGRIKFRFVHGVPNMSRDFHSVITKLGGGFYEISMMFVRADDVRDKLEGLDGEPIRRMIHLEGRLGGLELVRYSYSHSYADDGKSLYMFKGFGETESFEIELFPEEITYY